MNAVIAAWLLCALTPTTPECVALDLTVPEVLEGCYTPGPDGLVAPDRHCADIVEGYAPWSAYDPHGSSEPYPED